MSNTCNTSTLFTSHNYILNYETNLYKFQEYKTKSFSSDCKGGKLAIEAFVNEQYASNNS